MAADADNERWHFATSPVPVESSMIRSLRYDPAERLLEVVFLNGRAYQFVNVPQEVYQHLLEARSKGRYFLGHIRGVYPYWRSHRARRSRVEA